MYGSSGKIVENVLLAIDLYEQGQLDKAREIHEETLKTEEPFARYCYYQFLLKVGATGEASELFDRLLIEKFPPAIVRASIDEWQENSELGKNLELLKDLAGVADNGHIIAKKLLLKHKLVTSTPRHWVGILYKIWQLGREQRKIDADHSISNETIWY